jgi:hypothetical protein
MVTDIPFVIHIVVVIPIVIIPIVTVMPIDNISIVLCIPIVILILSIILIPRLTVIVIPTVIVTACSPWLCPSLALRLPGLTHLGLYHLRLDHPHLPGLLQRGFATDGTRPLPGTAPPGYTPSNFPNA